MEPISIMDMTQMPYFLATLCLFFICGFVNFSPIINLLIRPTLRSTLNNLCCALLLANLLFGCSAFFLFSLQHFFEPELFQNNLLCAGITIIPQFYRIVSLYILLGTLFLRSLFVKHARYISLVSQNNLLVISDFGIPVWVTIFSFILLNGLFMILHPNFPSELPNVRICRGVPPYRNNVDEALHFQTFLISVIGSIILASFVVSSHLRLHYYHTKFGSKTITHFRQNVNTVHQTIGAAYIKLITSLINSTLLHFQIVDPTFISAEEIQFCEMVAMSVECVAVPAFWLWETNKNFPELTSSRNTILKDCGENNLLSVIALDNIGETRNNNERPLTPRRPNFTQNFRSHAMNLINTTIIETSETSQKSTPDSTTSHFFDFRLRSVVAPMPTVHI